MVDATELRSSLEKLASLASLNEEFEEHVLLSDASIDGLAEDGDSDDEEGENEELDFRVDSPCRGMPLPYLPPREEGSGFYISHPFPGTDSLFPPELQKEEMHSAFLQLTMQSSTGLSLPSLCSFGSDVSKQSQYEDAQNEIDC
eukprot:TRINITY_DN7564_c0_g1_i1.p1 TRINITY_DN7564_c0_g1~~TRINITY_DN7564_c0_g1_i1.p1  ORF type:complete len:144 (-),score=13.72 TRINITY_DN7564_c0_g1_i1:287-718(-)